MRKAFTLVELLVTILIVAVLAGIFVAGYRSVIDKPIDNNIPPLPVRMEGLTKERPADIIPITLRGNKYIVIYKDPDHVTIHRQRECENEGVSGTDRTSDPKQLP